MITLALMVLIFGAFKILLVVVPNIPQMPNAVTDPLNFLAGFIGSGVGVVQHILSPAVFIALVAVGIALLSFDFAWAVFWWVLRKIPFVSVHVRK